MDFNALQKDLRDAAAAGGNSANSSNHHSGPQVEDMYEFLEELGHGAYGSVMKARKRKVPRSVSGFLARGTAGRRSGGSGGHLALNADVPPPMLSPSPGPPPLSPSSAPAEQFVAIKIIDKKKAGSKGLSEVMGEVETLRLLNHPNIVHLEDTFQDDHNLYIVMEYVPGGELHQVLKRVGAIPEATARQLIIQLLLAVEYIHQRGIVHRDLKPANMLLRDELEWQMKLADFGFAVLVGTESCLTSYCGTGAYMAPEIVLDMNYGKAVDLWAIGVILYVLMSGDYPFHATGGQDVGAAIVANKWQRTMHPKIAEASPGAKDFLSKLLTTDPLKRLTAREALKHTWVQAALQGLSHRVEASAVGRSGVVGSGRIVPPRIRFKSWVAVIVAMHRLVYLRKIRILRAHHADVAPLKNFSYLVTGKYEPVNATNTMSVSGLFPHQPKLVTLFVLPMVESSTTVETLDLSDNNIDSVDMVQSIVKALMHHPSVGSLVLEGNPIPALAGRGLVRLARAQNRIRRIALGGTLVGADVIQQVTNALKDKKVAPIAHIDGGASSASSIGGNLSGGGSALLGTGGMCGGYSVSPTPPSSTSGAGGSAHHRHNISQHAPQPSPSSSRSSSLTVTGSSASNSRSTGGVVYTSSALVTSGAQFHATNAPPPKKSGSIPVSPASTSALTGQRMRVGPQNSAHGASGTTTQQSRLPPIASTGSTNGTVPRRR